MIVLILLCLALVFIISAAETSFVAADKVALTITRAPKVETDSVFFFLKDTDLFFATVVVANSLAITTFSSVAEIFLHEGIGLSATVFLPLITVVGFLFGELIPKSLALESPVGFSRLSLPFLRAFYSLAKPLVDFTASFSKFIVRAVFRTSGTTAIFERSDVYKFLGDTAESGYLEKIESDIIRRLILNSGLPVRNFLVPRTQLVGVDQHTDVEKLREIFEKTGKTKVIIFDSSIDNVIGVVHAKDIFREVKTINELISDILFVPETISALDVLEEFKAERVYCAIIIDEFGGTSGLVTSSDIMEAFLGDVAIWNTEAEIRQIAGKQFLMQGVTPLSDVEKKFNLILPRGDYSTVSGLIFSQARKVPLTGEKIHINDLEFQIIKTDGRKLETIKLTLK